MSHAFVAPNRADRHARLPSFPLPVLGSELRVPLVTGGCVRYVHLDVAASAPCLHAVSEAINALLPWYSGVHRGSGFASTVMTESYEQARATVRAFVGASDAASVIFTRNTTDALNLLARALPEDTGVVTFASEHHANLLPWRHRTHVHLPVPGSPDEAIALADRALEALQTRHRVLSVAGASNVTGEIWPLEPLAAVAHAHGGRLVVDAAQLAPHRRIDVENVGIDYLALSGHKLYAPFGSGALIGHADWLDEARPYLAGGGAVSHVTLDDVAWSAGPARHEGGSPNVLGVLSLAAACRALAAAGMDRVEAHERRVFEGLVGVLRAREDVEVLSMWGPSSDRVGVATFNVRGWAAGAIAAALGAEHGIGLRAGAFCAQPLARALLGASGNADCSGGTGAVRASVGASTGHADVSRPRSGPSGAAVVQWRLATARISARVVSALNGTGLGIVPRQSSQSRWA
jgi:selenocysteine lyase/cysteine desulfurase